MSVESKNSKLGVSTNGDANKSAASPLNVKRGAVEPELTRIRQTLIAHRDNRDTTNHPSVEKASNDRQGAISRRFQKVNTPNRKKSLQKKSNPLITDSGTPDGDSDDGGGGTSDGGGVTTS